MNAEERVREMLSGVDEAISLVNASHGVGEFSGDIQRIAYEAFKRCQFSDDECRHAAWLGFFENFQSMLNAKTQRRCINGGICPQEENDDRHD
jgi:hypothetical protein